MLDLKDKIAIVSGCGSIGDGFGNGRAIATLLARQGAKVLELILTRKQATIRPIL